MRLLRLFQTLELSNNKPDEPYKPSKITLVRLAILMQKHLPRDAAFTICNRWVKLLG